MGADIVGFNCSVGPDLLVEAVRSLARVARVPVSVQPNAGLPRLSRDGRTEFPMGPEEFASYGPKLVEAGASIVGGCCGTTPEHIRQLKGAVAGMKPAAPAGPLAREFGLSSRTQAVFAVDSNLPLIIGERINPTGKKALSRDIKEGAFALLRNEAKAQAASGAAVLDVNVGVPLIDEVAAMSRAVLAAQEAVTLPLCLDSTSPEAIDAGLKAFVGKALINSFSLEDGKAEKVLPLARRYGAAVLGLTMDADGLPTSAEQRLDIAKRLVEKAASYGIPRWDVVIDPLALTAGAQQDQAFETLKAIRLIKSELGCRTSLGVSNVSYGLPNRPFLNSVFLTMALAEGLDMAIINPMDERVMDAVRATRVFFNRDVNSKEYIAVVGPKKLAHNEAEVLSRTAVVSARPVEAATEAPVQSDKIHDAVLEGDKDGTIRFVTEALLGGASPLELLDNHLIPAINLVGRRFGEGVYFLPQLMLSAGAMKAAFDLLRPEIAKARAAAGQAVEDKGVVVTATVEGDIHDIGKNIVAVLLENHGFRVVDLGRDVKAETILERAREEKADMVFLSALMTTTMPRMKEVVELFAAEGFDCPVLVGGAATTKSFAEAIGAKGYGRDAQEAVSLALSIIDKRGKRR
jgi:5-methyltetrahydrofolate--homocysteine methyltransferase